MAVIFRHFLYIFSEGDVIDRYEVTSRKSNNVTIILGKFFLCTYLQQLIFPLSVYGHFWWWHKNKWKISLVVWTCIKRLIIIFCIRISLGPFWARFFCFVATNINFDTFHFWNSYVWFFSAPCTPCKGKRKWENLNIQAIWRRRVSC